MAKGNKKKRKLILKKEDAINILPQNILLIGPQNIDEEKRIYIKQAIYQKIAEFTSDKIINETGGLLIGYTLEEFNKTYIIISGFVEAKFCEATPTTIKFTHKTWDYCHSEINRNFKNLNILGWIHTHPGLGVFLSDYDKFIQNNFFNGDNQIAYVIDPINNNESFYYWDNSKIKKCENFYLYDDLGKELLKSNSNNEQHIKEENARHSNFLNKILITTCLVLITLVLIFIINIVNVNREISNIKKEVKELQNNNINKYNYDQMNWLLLKKTEEFESWQENIMQYINEIESKQEVNDKDR